MVTKRGLVLHLGYVSGGGSGVEQGLDVGSRLKGREILD